MGMRGQIIITTLFIAFCIFKTCFAANCDKHCLSCSRQLQCGPGIIPVKDECGCCEICPKQLHDECDSKNPCDITKKLYCSFSETNSNMGMCVATPGRSCYIDNKVYLNGESFPRGSRYSCTCYDSDVTCRPMCPSKLLKLKNCAFPRLVRLPGKSCEQVICSKPQSYRNYAAFKSSPRVALKSMELFGNSHETATCTARTTRWTSCSETCGWGVSSRFTNDNKDCKLIKETRLCKIRHCQKSNSISRVSKRNTMIKVTKKHVNYGAPVRYSFLGCKSKVQVPRYCPHACVPRRTVTVAMPFVCENGKMFKKDVMMVKSCVCKGGNSI